MSGPSTNDNWTGGNAEWSTNGDWSAGTPNGAAYAVTLSNGATITVGSSDFSAYAGTLSVTSGSMVIDGTLNLGGLSVTSGSFTINGGSLYTGTETLSTTYNQTANIVVKNYGNLTVENGVNGTVSGTVTLETGGSYYWEDALASSSSANTVDFADGSGSTFSVEDPFAGTVQGFQAGDSIQDNYGTGTATHSFGTNSVTVTMGGQSITIKFTGGTYNSSNVSVSSSGVITTTYTPPAPEIASATYNASTGQLVVTAAGNGDNFTTNAADFDPTQLTLAGEDSGTYTLTGGSVSNVSSTSFTVTVTAADQLQLDGLLNKSGTSSTGNDIFNSGAGATTYEISANGSFDVGGRSSSGGVTVSSPLTPTITGVTYNRTTGLLTFTGTGFENQGDYGGINLGQITLKNSSGGSFTFNAGDYGNATSTTQVSIDLSNTTSTEQQTVMSGEEASVNALFASGTFTLAATSGWDSGAGAAITAQSVSLGGSAATISSESDSSPSGSDIDAGKTVTFTVNFSAAVTVSGSPELTLNNGHSASLTSGSGTTGLVFSYTVQSSDNISDLEATAFNLNGGTVQTGGVNANLSGFTTINTGVQLDTTAPTVTSINRVSASPNNATSEQFTVTFSEAVTGVAAGDFALTTSGSLTDTGISSISGSGTTYTVTVGNVAGDGTLRLDLKSGDGGITDAAGNGAAAAFTSGQTYTVEQTPPTVTSVGVPANGTYIAGQALDFTANFSEAVTVTGTPEIAITLDTGGTVEAQYLSGSGTSALIFGYTVVSGEQDLTGITVGSAITLNGGSIKDAATNAATLTLNAVASTSGVDVDAIPPTVTSVGVPADGTYGTGQVLAFTVDFSKNVLVTTGGGTPYIDVTLDTGGTVQAFYTGGSGTSALTFALTVVSGEADTNGITVGSSIVLNGGAIKDAVTNSAVLTLNSVASTANVDVDAIPPTATSIDIAGTSPNNASSDAYTVTFSTAVTGVDASDFTLVGTGTAAGVISAVSGSGTTWTVAVGGVTGDGTLVLDLNNTGDPITDAYGNTLVASRTGDESYTVQHTPPAATAMTVPADGTYPSGSDLNFTVTFSEAVTVTTAGGTPRIAIALDTGGTVYADYVSGSGTSTLAFQYQIVPGEQDLTGITTGTAIDTNGGTIKDAAGNNANLAINTVEPSLAGVDVDAILPVVDTVSVPANATYIAGQDLDFTVNFNKAITVNTSGTPYIQLTVGTANVDAYYVVGSDTASLTFAYVVVPDEEAASGVVLGSAIVLNGGTLQDNVGNPVTLTLNGVASTASVDVDSTPPTVTSIDIAGTSPNNASSDAFTVTFSEAVTGVTAANFSAVGTGTVSGTGYTVTGSGATYTVTDTGVTGNGTLSVDLSSTNGIADLATNPLQTTHSGDQSYTLDHTPPTVGAAPTVTAPQNSGALAIGIGAPSDNETAVGSLAITVTALPTDGTVTLADGVTPVTLAETLTAAQLEGLEFTPTQGAYSQSSVFGYTVTDLAGNQTPGSATLKVGPPGMAVIVSTHALADSANGPVDPFTGVTITDPSSGAIDTLTISVTGITGTLAGVGLSGGTNGVYTLTGTAAAVTAELDALVFTPDGTPNATSTANIILSDMSSASPIVIGDGRTKVTETLPAVGSTLIATAIPTTTFSRPFAQVTVVDPNGGVSPVIDTLTITQTGGGTLSGSGLTSAGGGVYTLSGSAVAVTSALDALTFTPAGGASASFALSDANSVFGGAPSQANVVVPGTGGLADALVASGTLAIGAGYTETGYGVGSTTVLAVQFGGTISNTVVSSGGTLELFAGATTIGLVTSPGAIVDVESGYTLTVSAGQAIDGVTVLNGGAAIIAAGGSAIGTTIESGAGAFVAGSVVSASLQANTFLLVSAGGVASATTVSSGGLLLVSGSADATTLSGGVTDVLSGGSDSGTLVAAGAEVVSAGGSATGMMVAAGAGAFDYGSTTSATLSAGAFMLVEAGGIANATVVSAGAQLLVSGTADATALSGGVTYVLAGGSDSGTLVAAGAEVVSAGGSATRTMIAAGAGVFDYGATTSATISSGAFMVVETGGTASATIVSAGAQLLVSGTADATAVSGGVTYVLAGGSDSGTLVAAGAEVVSAGGSATGLTIAPGAGAFDYGATTSATIEAGAFMVVETTGSATATVLTGGNLFVSGVASGTIVSGGVETVSSGGTDLGATLSGGAFVVSSGGTSENLHIDAGAGAFVYGSAAGATVSSGGFLLELSGGTANATTVASGGSLQIAGTDSGTVVASGGVELILSGGTDSGTTLSGGSEVVSSGGVISGTVDFAAGGLLNIASPSNFAAGALVAGFTSPSDILDFSNISFASSPTLAWSQLTAQSGTLTISAGGVTDALTLLGQYTTANFISGSDATGGTTVIDPPVTSALVAQAQHA